MKKGQIRLEIGQICPKRANSEELERASISESAIGRNPVDVSKILDDTLVQDISYKYCGDAAGIQSM